MESIYLIVDLEATCWTKEESKDKKSEIIEIGAILFDPIQKENKGEFQTFVKPILFPILSEFCTSLTSITQHHIADAPSFPQAMQMLKEQVLDKYYSVTLCSWGSYDKKQLEKDCALHKIPYPFGNKHINIKQMFADQKMVKPCGMHAALSMLQLPLIGTHHRGIDDARNIACIFKTLL